MKLTDAVKDYLNCCKYEKKLSEKTLSAYNIDFYQVSRFCEANDIFTVSDLGKSELRAYIRVILEKYKPKSAKRKLASLKAFFNWLEYEEIITVTPFRKIKIKIREGNRLPKIIPKEELGILFSSRDSHQNNFISIRNRTIFEVLFSTGMRVGELCGLLLENLDINEGALRIIGKGDKERLIPICSEETTNVIKEYLEERNSRFDSKYFLLTRTGGRMQEQNIRLILHKRAKEMGLSDITPHMFRHSFATYLLEEGVDIRYIQALMGHSSITTTQIYTTVNEKKQRELLTEHHPRKLISICR